MYLYVCDKHKTATLHKKGHLYVFPTCLGNSICKGHTQPDAWHIPHFFQLLAPNKIRRTTNTRTVILYVLWMPITWHYDVVVWIHFPHYWPFVLGMHGRASMFLLLAWSNCFISSRFGDGLRSHDDHVTSWQWRHMIIMASQITYHHTTYVLKATNMIQHEYFVSVDHYM